MRVFLTGSSSGLASALLPLLCSLEAISEVRGVDLRAATFQHPKFVPFQGDIRSLDLPLVMQDCDAVVHAAYAVMQGRLSNAELFDNNVGASLRVFSAAATVGAKVINLSSVSVYGRGEALEESAPLQPAPHFLYACHKAHIEQLAHRDFPGVIHLRSHLILGPHAQPFLHQMCRSLLCIVPPPQPLLQVVHESDVAQAIALCLARDVQGAFNLASPEPISLPALVRHGRRFMVPLPLSWVRRAVAVAQRLGSRDEFTWLGVMDTPLTVSTQRAERLLGWRAVHSPWQARESMR